MAHKPKNQKNNVSSRKSLMTGMQARTRKPVARNIVDECEYDYIAYAIGCAEDCPPWRGAAAYQTINVEDGEISDVKTKFLFNTTSNKLHLLAIMSAVNSIPEGSRVIVYTQSQFAANILSGEWKAKKHKNLIKNYKEIAAKRNVEINWKPFYLTSEFKEMRKIIELMPEMDGVSINVRHKHEILK